jgi:Zn-dependent M28 family amino/carboxypeptidase
MALALPLVACAKDAATSVPSPTPERQTTPFDGERALAHVRAQVEFGPRPAGSPALERTREYLLKELRSYKLQVAIDEFKPATPRGPVVMKNLIAELPGETPETIMIGSHYDTKHFQEFAFVGANDAGSSTGALLELARVMAADPARRRFTYQFVFFDGEEAFCREWSECLDGKDNTYGSRHLVERLKREQKLARVKAMILLDMVGDKDLTIPREQTSSGWLVEAIWSTAAELGHTREFLSRPFTIGDDDHLPFLRERIPAVDVIDFEYGAGAEDNSYWHTAEDTLDKVSARSLKIVGDVILLSLPKIERQIR